MSDATDRAFVEHANRLFPRMKGRIFATRHLARRAMATAHMIEWLLRPEQQAIRDQIRGLQPEGYPAISMETAIRMTLLRAISPLEHELGAKMELHIQLIQNGLEMIEWKEVVHALEGERDDVPGLGDDRKGDP